MGNLKTTRVSIVSELSLEFIGLFVVTLAPNFNSSIGRLDIIGLFAWFFTTNDKNAGFLDRSQVADVPFDPRAVAKGRGGLPKSSARSILSETRAHME